MASFRIVSPTVAGLVLAVSACSSNGNSDDPDAAPAIDSGPSIDAAEGSATAEVTGSFVEATAIFVPADPGAEFTLDVEKAPEGDHGIRLQLGDCDDPGEVWDLGVIGDMTIEGEDGHFGSGSMTETNEEWTIGDGAETDVVGKVVVVYGGAGETNGVLACGVVE